MTDGIRTNAAADRALDPEVLRAIPARALLEYVTPKRWFGAKAGAVRSARIADALPVTWPGSDTRYAVVRLAVDVVGIEWKYQLFLAAQPDAGGSGSASTVLIDALELPEFRRGLADAFAQNASFENAGTRWTFETESATPLLVPSAERITLGSGEQSNSSVHVGEEAMLKLFRKIEPGEHPDVEVTRFLTVSRKFIHVPALLGSIYFQDASGVTIAGMLQEYVPGATDGWRYALDCSREYFAAENVDEHEHPFDADAERLGKVTRAMHETLASGEQGSEFEIQRATPDDVRRWTRGAETMIERASVSLETTLSKDILSADHVADARNIVERRGAYLDWLAQVAGEIGADAGACTRTHGDYHLGQVLRSSAQRFLVIDFEGEPARPLRERRARTSPLRDVAGMLRSFAYVAAVAGRDNAARAASWERGAREAFLHGYFNEQGSLELLPLSRDHASRLIALFEAEKVFYELQYELDHRPDWAWIPLHGIAQLYA